MTLCLCSTTHPHPLFLLLSSPTVCCRPCQLLLRRTLVWPALVSFLTSSSRCSWCFLVVVFYCSCCSCCCCCCSCYRRTPHVLTVINLTGISEIYATNTLSETLSLHAAKCCTVAAPKVPNIELSIMFITRKSGNNARPFIV